MRFARLIFLIALALPFTNVAAEPQTLDQRIDAVVAPVANAISSAVFYEITLPGDTKLPLIMLWLILGALVCTFYFRFINVRGFAHGFRLIRGDYADPTSPGEVSQFQALTSAVSGTVGLGNIAGVAVAITIGGPGATLWMILAGVLGMSTKFAECSLGVMYRREHADGSVSGGPMYYLNHGIAINYPRLRHVGRALAGVFAFCAMLGAVGSGALFQSNQAYAQVLNITGGADGPLAGYAWLFGVGVATLAGIVIIGGITRIGAVTAKLVPFMAAIYVVAALFVIGSHLNHVPAAFLAIWDGAFSAHGVQGGVIGALIVGFRRAAFSNEAGIGSAPIAHAAVKTRHPITEGFVALWEPFLDTVVICTMTALVIIITGQYSAGASDGVQLTSEAFGSVISWFPYVLTFVVFLFAYSTIITWGYYGAKATAYLFGDSRLVLYVFKFFFLGMVIVGCTMSLNSIVGIADALMFIMAIPNLIGVYLLLPVIRRALRDYQAQLAEGKVPSHRGHLIDAIRS
ncbi:MAG: alanine glycine permease [Gammaproteobacteria bacterium HGW-Gammaproteobacteria-4]|nr:MAG: alanine glycine permease [Gammaproteobacteria bacterium HGW-Gammaproteobacteria-4]